MDEVSRQMAPMHAILQGLKDAVQEVKTWQFGFWSNGSGRAPGFFQSRIKADLSSLRLSDGAGKAPHRAQRDCGGVHHRITRFPRLQGSSAKRKLSRGGISGLCACFLLCLEF